MYAILSYHSGISPPNDPDDNGRLNFDDTVNAHLLLFFSEELKG
jgi:hypothetical protein